MSSLQWVLVYGLTKLCGVVVDGWIGGGYACDGAVDDAWNGVVGDVVHGRGIWAEASHQGRWLRCRRSGLLSFLAGCCGAGLCSGGIRWRWGYGRMCGLIWGLRGGSWLGARWLRWSWPDRQWLEERIGLAEKLKTV